MGRVARWCTGYLCVLPVLLCGCLNEKSFPLHEAELVHLTPPATALASTTAPPASISTRQWTVGAHSQLRDLLPAKGRNALTIELMRGPDGEAVDVYQAMDKPKMHLGLICKNFNALVHSTQAAAPGYFIDAPASAWQGFETVWIPVADEVQLCGRLGWARSDDQTASADCIILLPGIWGDNGVLRTRDLAFALRELGFHVLALELRGHGQTEARYPEVHFTFGVQESYDLLQVSEWLEDHYPAIRGTGLLGFCWGSNVAILAAWLDGCGGRHPAISPRLAARMPAVSPRPHFTAGVLGFSTVVDWERVVDQSDRPHVLIAEPAAHAMENVNLDRMIYKEHPERSGNLRRLINYEFAASSLTASYAIADARRFLRFVPYRHFPRDDKLGSIRVPTLIVHAVNDPFTYAQAVADLLVSAENPLVAGLITRGGGHIGFFPYNPSYSYSLIANFFDPRVGAAALAPARGTGEGLSASTVH